MSRASGRISPQERTFLEHYANSGDRVYAAEKAGYAQPGTSASKNLAKPKVAEAVMRIQMRRITDEALPLAVDTVLKLMRDAKTPPNVKGTVALGVMKHAQAIGVGAEAKEPHEMTADEIRREIDRLEAVSASRAVLVNPEGADEAEAIEDDQADEIDPESSIFG